MCMRIEMVMQNVETRHLMDLQEEEQALILVVPVEHGVADQVTKVPGKVMKPKNQPIKMKPATKEKAEFSLSIRVEGLKKHASHVHYIIQY